MKKNLIKISSLILSGLMITSALPAFAYEKDVNGNSVEFINYQNSEDSNVTNVYAEIGSEYKVTIPKTIILSGIDKKADYYVKVEGDIAGYETVNVVPDETVNLYTKNKDVQAGTITQDKTAWKFDNFDVNANGTVEASGLTAGKWSGTFNFNIELSDEQTIVVEKVLGDLVLPPVDEWDSINVPVTATFGIGETGSMNALKASLDESESMTITSSNENVAIIKDNKTIRAIAPGKTKITTLIESEENTKSFSFDLKVSESLDVQVELPEIGTSLSDMSFKEIQAVAKAGKAADYDIKIGDILKVNDEINARVVSIGKDYIEFCTVQKVVEDCRFTKNITIGYASVGYNEISSYYDSPQVDFGTDTAEIGYVGSNIKKSVEKWLDSQSYEFKSVLKDTERTYDVVTMTHKGQLYYQSFSHTVTDIEKVYIPTGSEVANLYNVSNNYRTNGFWWTASPAYPCDNPANALAFGFFAYSNSGTITFNSGNYFIGAIAMFRIG